MHCGMDFDFCTEDLRYGNKEGTVLKRKDIILPALNFHKGKYDESGIMKSVNRHNHTNECGGKAKGINAEAVKVVEDFIKGYMAV